MSIQSAIVAVTLIAASGIAAAQAPTDSEERARAWAEQQLERTCCARPDSKPTHWIQIGDDANQTDFVDRNSISMQDGYVVAIVLSSFKRTRPETGVFSHEILANFLH